MERRFLLAFALSFAILLGYPYLMARLYGPPPKQTPLSSISPQEKPLQEVAENEAIAVPTLFLETDKVKVGFHPAAGSIQQVILKQHLDEIKAEPLELVKVEDIEGLIGSIWIENPKLEPIFYEIVEHSAQKVKFRAELPEKLVVEKAYEVDNESYTLHLYLTFKNETTFSLPLYYRLLASSSLKLLKKKEEERFFEVLTSVQGKRKRIHLNQVKKAPFSSEEKPGWVALKEKYFSAILKPETPFTRYGVFAIDEKENMAVSVWAAPQDIPPGGELRAHYLFYFGPNDLRELRKAGPWAEETIDYGMFNSLAKFLVWALTATQGVVRSYGLSIILLTFLISILFLPLTGISYNSMKRMKLLQPEVNQIRTLYKGKPQRLNKELMELYKRHKVNPLGGCLPMLIQMPIFIAFYQALVHSIELKGVSFLFIKDLSLPDQAIPLPFHVGPLGDAVNLLPILMAIAMFIQQKMTTPMASSASEAETQKMMAFMPLLFGFIFYGLPSGLVLYWLTNNIIMIVNQKLIFK
ncbi:MAG: membrane protein insertase YidC [Candidatus Omnitrophica bacterium]|nr:membrane protein insertase YidC [Candidatus Omnitrophota bacterium]